MTYRTEKFFCKPMEEQSFLKLKKILFSYGFRAIVSSALKKGLKELRDDYHYTANVAAKSSLFSEDYYWDKYFAASVVDFGKVNLRPIRKGSFYRARWTDEKTFRQLGKETQVMENSDEFLFHCEKKSLDKFSHFYIRSLTRKEDRVFWSRIIDLCPNRQIFFAKDQISPSIGSWSDRMIFKLLIV